MRYAAAKGLGRVAARLPGAMCTEVAGFVAEEASTWLQQDNDMGVHGACLAAAELARRGLLGEAHLDATWQTVAGALVFDVRRGAHSVGAHVRDAGAYVCWAMARAYPPTVLSRMLTVLAEPLLCCACYDREVNCRRAAAAAFQEAVGRTGGWLTGWGTWRLGAGFLASCCLPGCFTGWLGGLAVGWVAGWVEKLRGVVRLSSISSMICEVAEGGSTAGR